MPPSLWDDPRELERRLQQLEPAVRIVPERHVRRYTTSGEPATFHPAMPLWTRSREGPVLLLAAADDRFPKCVPDDVLLYRYGRLLFRARVMLALHECGATKGFDVLPAAFAREALLVLVTDGLLPDAERTLSAFCHVGSLFCELAHFEPDRVADVFPAATDGDAILSAFGDLDLPALASRSMPAGAKRADAHAFVALPEYEASEAGPTSPADVPDGNYVRAAIRRLESGDRPTAEMLLRAGVADPLAELFGWPVDQREIWFQALRPLLDPALHGGWAAARKVLYDLQNLAREGREGLRAVAPVEWALSLGRKPLSYSLDPIRDAIVLRRLLGVARNVERSPVPAPARELLRGLIAAEAELAESRVRQDLGPKLHAALDEAGLVEGNATERVARGKIVGELLDAACERGFVRFSDLRDALARNRLKLADLSGPGEWLRGDALLRADRALARVLPGLYHRGELYLRAIQRGSSLFFGTVVGRFLTLFLLLPFGAAFVALEGLQHGVHAAMKAWHFLTKATVPVEPELDIDEFGEVVSTVATSAAEPIVHFVTLPAVVGLGLFLLLVIHAPAVRRVVVAILLDVLRVLRFLIVGLPARLIRSRVVRIVFSHPLTSAAIPAGALAAGAALLMVLLGAPPNRIARWWGGLFLALLLVALTPPGRRAREAMAESASDAWRAFLGNFLPGLVSWIGWLSREFLGTLDAAVYAVDEKFRYRDGASRPSVALRATLALIWFPIAYATRFAFYLLIEPQINPVKHFPVVTVSHKVLLPLAPAINGAVGNEAVTAVLLTGSPGMFGFLVWEFKENWRLYAANRPADIAPVVVGSHGETVRGLLRPGFHSGAIPRSFRKLRRGWVHASLPDEEVAERERHQLGHVAESLRRTLVRELFAAWQLDRRTAHLRAHLAGIDLCVQSIVVRITLGDAPEELVLACDYADGHLAGTLVAEGWMKHLAAEAREAVEVSLIGLAAMAGVERETAGDSSPAVWQNWVRFWG